MARQRSGRGWQLARDGMRRRGLGCGIYGVRAPTSWRRSRRHGGARSRCGAGTARAHGRRMASDRENPARAEAPGRRVQAQAGGEGASVAGIRSGSARAGERLDTKRAATGPRLRRGRWPRVSTVRFVPHAEFTATVGRVRFPPLRI
eukprot:5215292-Prymnesium_polylepis.1